MNFLNTLFFMLIGIFSINEASTLQPNSTKEISSHITLNKQDTEIKAIIFNCDGTLIDMESDISWIGNMPFDVKDMS